MQGGSISVFEISLVEVDDTFVVDVHVNLTENIISITLKLE